MSVTGSAGDGLGRVLRARVRGRRGGRCRPPAPAVFCLDVTDADSHTLEAGLKVTAADTGGFFVRTHLFPGQAMRRLSGALAGF